MVNAGHIGRFTMKNVIIICLVAAIASVFAIESAHPQNFASVLLLAGY